MTDALATRIAAAAALTGHTVDALLAHLADVAKPLREVAVHTNADTDAIAVSIALPDDEWLARRMANLANAISPSTALAQTALARAGRRRAERGIGRQGRPARGLAGVFSSLAITGPSTLAAELSAADAAGIPGPVREDLAARARLLGLDDDRLAGTDRLFRTLVYSGPDDATTSVELGAESPHDVVTRASAASSVLGLADDDLRRLRALHTALAVHAPDQPGELRLTASQSSVAAGFTLAYAGLSTDDLLALAGQFSDAGVQRMQAFVEALAPASIEHVHITFGDRALGPLWVGFRLR